MTKATRRRAGTSRPMTVAGYRAETLTFAGQRAGTGGGREWRLPEPKADDLHRARGDAAVWFGEVVRGLHELAVCVADEPPPPPAFFTMAEHLRAIVREWKTVEARLDWPDPPEVAVELLGRAKTNPRALVEEVWWAVDDALRRAERDAGGGYQVTAARPEELADQGADVEALGEIEVRRLVNPDARLPDDARLDGPTVERYRDVAVPMIRAALRPPAGGADREVGLLCDVLARQAQRATLSMMPRAATLHVDPAAGRIVVDGVVRDWSDSREQLDDLARLVTRKGQWIPLAETSGATKKRAQRLRATFRRMGCDGLAGRIKTKTGDSGTILARFAPA